MNDDDEFCGDVHGEHICAVPWDDIHGADHECSCGATWPLIAQAPHSSRPIEGEDRG